MFTGAKKKKKMKIKSHFWYTTNQRNGILLLLVIIIMMQFCLHFLKFGNEYVPAYDEAKINFLRHQIDSIQNNGLAIKKIDIYPFNPNYLSDFKGYQLGMSTEQIDRLFAYRKKNLFVNSAMEFQKVTKVSDNLLKEISPFFKFPDWIQKKKKKHLRNNASVLTKKNINDNLSSDDLNKANKNDLLSIRGVDDALSERVIKYRSALQGFSEPDQLLEVWGMQTKVASQILKVFSIKEKPIIEKINVNTASFKEVLSIPYIDYDLCVKIFDYRDEVAELQSISELKNIKDFPTNKYDRIVLYLRVE